MHRRTSDWDHQRGARLSPVLVAWGTCGRWRVGSGLLGFQSQALPYLILGVIRKLWYPSSAFGHHLRPYSLGNRVLFCYPSPCHERYTCWQSGSYDCSSVLSDKLLGIYAPESIPGLIQQVLSSKDQLVIDNSIIILKNIREDVVKHILASLFPIIPQRTILLVQVLEHLPDPQSIPPLISILEMPQLEAPLVLAALQALSQYLDK